jgi:FdhD protein
MDTHPTDATRFNAGHPETVRDTLAVEAALQIRLNGEDFVTVMRTPGNDSPLVRGLLFTEGIVPNTCAKLSLKEIADPETGLVGCVEVAIDVAEIAKSVEGRHALTVSSSCGLCGTKSAADLAIFGPPVYIAPDQQFEINTIPTLFEAVHAKQRLFAETGGCHAAAAFDASGTLLAVYEDIGRHNAVDKVVGSLIADDCLDNAQTLTVSGRISYEILYKAYHAGIPFVLGVSAPSSLAVESADRLGMVLAGFCRGDQATVYSHPERVQYNDGSEDSENPPNGFSTP